MGVGDTSIHGSRRHAHFIPFAEEFPLQSDDIPQPGSSLILEKVSTSLVAIPVLFRLPNVSQEPLTLFANQSTVVE